MAGREEQKRRQSAVARAKAEARADLLRQVREVVEQVEERDPECNTWRTDVLVAIDKLRDKEEG